VKQNGTVETCWAHNPEICGSNPGSGNFFSFYIALYFSRFTSFCTARTCTHNHFTAPWILPGTTRVSRYQKKHFTHSHLSWSSVIPYLLPPSITIHGILPVQFTCMTVFSTISLQVFFGLLLGLAPSTSYSIHFFTQSLSSFCSTCPYHHNLFCHSTEIMSSNPSLCLNPLLIIELYLVA